MQADTVDWENGRITDEGLAFMRSRLGVPMPDGSWNTEVTRDGVWHFAHGIGDDNPLWYDRACAEASPWGRTFAPPCCLYSHFNGPLLRPEQGRLSVDEYLPGVLALWAGDRWRWLRPAYVGEEILPRTELTEVTVDEGAFGGRSVTQVEKVSLVSSNGDLVAEVCRTLKRFERGATRGRSRYLDRARASYTEDDRARFADQYRAEAARRRGPTLRAVTDVQVGERLPRLLKGPLTVNNLVGFMQGWGGPLCAANRMSRTILDLHPGVRMLHPVSGIEENIESPHWDRELARASGMADGYDFGGQRISWLSHLVTDWMGDAGFLQDLEVQLRRPNFLGDVTWLDGEVVAVTPRDGVVTISLQATNQLDEVTAKGVAKVRLPAG